MRKLFRKILSLILAVFMPTATVIPMTEPVKIEDTTVSVASDYIFGGTNYGHVVDYLIKDDNGVKGFLYSNGEIIITGADTSIKDLVIPDEIDGYPVTAIADRAFASEPDVDLNMYYFDTVTIGDNVRYIGKWAFGYQESIQLIVFGENVEEIGQGAFEVCNPQKIVWNDKIKILRSCAFAMMIVASEGVFPLPDSIEILEYYAIGGSQDTIVVRENVKYIEKCAIWCDNLVVLNMDMEISSYEKDSTHIGGFPNDDAIIYCLENSTMHQKLKSGEINNEYHLIENAYLTSETVDISEDYVISGLQGGLTENDLKSYLNVEGEAEIRVSDEVVKTGTKIELVNADPEFVYKTYTAVVDGDINGDGLTGAAEDFSAMRDIITGSDSEYSDINKQAADLNSDGIVNSTDLTIMKSLLN
ncbi:MAG: leucine-rich repeat protein [Clostridia bacterium]|nr:leucine-rich repeat protein [Clostridia bacterium]